MVVVSNITQNNPATSSTTGYPGQLPLTAQSAAGNNSSANAFQIPTGTQFVQFGTVGAATNSARILGGNEVGEVLTVRNDGLNNLNLFPPTGGQINGGGANVAIVVAVGASATVISTGSLLYLTVSNNVAASFATAPVVAAIDSAVITAAQSGSIFAITATATNPSVLTLPAIAAGLNYKFVIQVVPAHDMRIQAAAGAAILAGGVIVNSVNIPVVPVTSVRVNFIQASATIGDHISCFSDGVAWYFDGLGTAAGSITVV